MRYCSEDAPRTEERSVNLNKNTSENAALNEMFHPDLRALSFIFKYVFIVGVASLSNERALASITGDFGFKTTAGEFEHSDTDGARHRCYISSKGAVWFSGAMMRK